MLAQLKDGLPSMPRGAMEARWLVWRQGHGRYTPRPSRPAPERNMTGRRLTSGADHQPTRGLPRRNPTKRIASRDIDIEWNRLRATLPREARHDADSDLRGRGQSATGRGTVRGGGSAAWCRRDVQAECGSSQRRCTRSLQASRYYTRTLVKLKQRAPPGGQLPQKGWSGLPAQALRLDRTTPPAPVAW